jgi:hypothetical protein
MKARTGRNVTGRTQRKDRKGQAKHEPDFHFGLRKKREFALFSFALGAFAFFRTLFSSRFRALFFASRSRARKREKSAGAHLWI